MLCIKFELIPIKIGFSMILKVTLCMYLFRIYSQGLVLILMMLVLASVFGLLILLCLMLLKNSDSKLLPNYQLLPLLLLLPPSSHLQVIIMILLTTLCQTYGALVTIVTQIGEECCYGIRNLMTNRKIHVYM